jgi:3-phosphoshikimate 1-carboxyvinyltransferase
MASAGEPRGAIEIGSAPLRAITVEAEDVPAMIDELPLLAVLAARARGQTVVRGAQELRVKESDRIEATVRGLRAVGVDAVAQPDGFRIRGGEAPLRGSVVTRGDHRLAMAFGVLGALPGNHIEIDEPGAVAVSYPGFWEELARVREAHGLP